MRPTVPLALALAALPAQAQVCTPTASSEGSYRHAMTHRAPGPASAGGISVATFQAWSPPDGVEDDRVRGRDGPIDPREGRAATLEGDLWRVKVGRNGCDLLLELSATRAGRDSPHVLAAIPAGPGYEAARAAITAAVGLRSGRRSGRVELREPVHVRLTGYLFWDGARWCAESPGRGCGRRSDLVASLWELHPVWRVEVDGGAAGGGCDEDTTHRRHRRHHRSRAEER
jgi:hypothetical protein